MGLSSSSSRSQRTAGRAGAFVFVVGLHIVGIAGLLHMRSSERTTPEPAMQVVSLSMEKPADEAPRPQLELMEVPPVEIVVPLVSVEITQPMVAITPPPAPPSPPQRAQVQQVSLEDDAPVMLRDEEIDLQDAPPPRYPRAAKLARAQGTVLIWVLIDGEGRPKEARVHRSSGFEQLDQEGRQAVLGWRFRPYRRDGVARAAQAIVPVQFMLNTPRRG